MRETSYTEVPGSSKCSEDASSGTTPAGLDLDRVLALNSTVSPLPGNYRSQNPRGSGLSHSQICTTFPSCPLNFRLCQLEVLVTKKGELTPGKTVMFPLNPAT